MASTIRIKTEQGWEQLTVTQAVGRAEGLLRSGQSAAAYALLGKVLQFQPSHSGALRLRSTLLVDSGRANEAVECLQKALSRNERSAELHRDLGRAWARAGKSAEALSEFERAVALGPENPDNHTALAGALMSSGRNSEAESAARRALALKSDHAGALCNLAAAVSGLGRYEEAVETALRSLKIQPDDPDTLVNLGVALHHLGRFDESDKALERAYALSGSREMALKVAGARYNRGLAFLRSGDFVNGWREYEWRFRSELVASRSFPQRQWDGGDITGKTILLHAEQGLGDTIQFVRFAPLVRERGARVVLEVQPALIHLLSGLDGVDQIVPTGAELPPFDVQCPLLSVPRALGTTATTIPTPSAYLSADKVLQDRWRARLAGVPGLKVGMVWAGSRTHANDHNRSLKLEQLLPIIEVPDVSFFSLQVGPPTEDIARLGLSSRIADLSPDLPETAAALMELDLLIAVDTSIAHLAGALGRPVWLLLSHPADWRWLADREDSPWYANMRLFRQEVEGDWPCVVSRVAGELRRLAAHHEDHELLRHGASPIANRDVTDVARWSNPANLDPAWNDRARMAADLIPAGASILDLACGAMALEGYLPRGCTYVPCDVVRRDARTILCNFNREEITVPRGTSHISLLGALEYISDWQGFLKQLRAANVPVILSYSPTDFTAHLDRTSLGWINHIDLRTLCAALEELEFHIQTSLRADGNQVLLKLAPGSRRVQTTRKVAILSYNHVGNFGDRLGFHLINSILPAGAVAQYCHFAPWDVPEEDFDLAIVGLGNSLFNIPLSDELQRFLERVPRSIGIFGTQYRENFDRSRLDAVIDRLSVWYARYEEDVLLYGRGHGNVVHLGDWLINAFPLTRWTKDATLRIGQEIWQDLPLDRTIQTIQQFRSVHSTRIHPLLCALTSAEEVAYAEQREDGTGKRSGKFGSMLMDIFGRRFPEDTPFRFNRDSVAAYRAKVQSGITQLQKTLNQVLEAPAG